LEETGICYNVAAGIHSPKRYLGYRKEYLKPDQVTRLLTTINRLSIQGLRDYAVVNLMVRTGMRCTEVSRTNIKDLLIEVNNWIIYIQGKGHMEKDRALGLSLKVVNPIKEYISALGEVDESGPLFRNHSYISSNTRLSPVTISKFVKRYMRSIGIDSPKLTAHSLRHTAAITALKNGATLYEVSRMLGHRSIETTQIYVRAIEEEMSREGTAVRRLDNAYDTAKKNSKSKEIHASV
jgi:site-specific recombinase XerD